MAVDYYLGNFSEIVNDESRVYFGFPIQTDIFNLKNALMI